MSLASIFDDIHASCVHVPQYSVLESISADTFRVTYALSVNRPSWNSWFDAECIVDSPSPPATFNLKFYERRPTLASTDPIVAIGGFIADCSQLITELGTSRWMIMATLGIVFANSSVLTPRWIHIQQHGSNSGSIGLYKAPFIP